MKTIEKWILETVVDPEDWVCAKLRAFNSYEELTDYINKQFDKFGETPVYSNVIKANICEDDSIIALVYDEDDMEDPYYVVHKIAFKE